MTIIIGIDPGSRITGYGIIRLVGNKSSFIDCGSLYLTGTKSHEKLSQIYSELKKIVTLHKPDEAAIEQIFMHQNPNSALKLGQARGAAMVALGVPISEYSARQVKQSIVGYGAAKKEQIQHMIKRLLNISEELQADAADALAIALCHAHSRSNLQKGISMRRKKSSWRNFTP